jgi:hypothetical protein
MAGCRYCGKLHAPLLVCDEQRAAMVAPVDKPMANERNPMANDKVTYRYRDPEKRRAYLRTLMAKRRQKAR